MTVRWGPAQRGEAASADSGAPALPATGAKRRCRVPLMPFGFFRLVSRIFQAKRRYPLRRKGYEFRKYPVFICADLRNLRNRARKASKMVVFLRSKKGVTRHLAQINFDVILHQILAGEMAFKRDKKREPTTDPQGRDYRLNVNTGRRPIPGMDVTCRKRPYSRCTYSWVMHSDFIFIHPYTGEPTRRMGNLSSLC